MLNRDNHGMLNLGSRPACVSDNVCRGIDHQVQLDRLLGYRYRQGPGQANDSFARYQQCVASEHMRLIRLVGWRSSMMR